MARRGYDAQDMRTETNRISFAERLAERRQLQGKRAVEERLHLRNGLMIGFHFVSRYFRQHAPRVAAKLRAKKVVEMGVRVEQMFYC